MDNREIKSQFCVVTRLDGYSYGDSDLLQQLPICCLNRIRTDDLFPVKKALLNQLSYKAMFYINLVRFNLTDTI